MENRTVLVTRGPGTGKSTLAMQFLQAGLDRDDDCLFISTEQMFEELADAISSFAFYMDDENLTVTSLQATPGQTVDTGDEPELTLATLRVGTKLGSQYLELKKSPSGYMGSTRLVEYVQEEPYMRIQQPPGSGTAVPRREERTEGE